MSLPADGTVWILGAGFSRSLGAPLFNEIFRHDFRIEAALEAIPTEIADVFTLYRKHASTEVGGAGQINGTIWNNAEEFLFAIESAAAGSAYSSSLFRAFTRHDLKNMANFCRMALAIECSHFLAKDDMRAERWLPYRIWAAQLSAADTVLTFNYDLIPELLSGNTVDGKVGQGKLEVVIPPRRGIAKEDELGDAQRKKEFAPVFKLHGSVDWYIENGAIVSDRHRPYGRVGEDPPLLGIPGPRKAALRENEFEGVWAAGKAAIHNSSRIVFVGYRFPATDAQARIDLLRSIAFAPTAKQHVEVVLGPGVNEPDVVRMEALLNLVNAQAMVRPFWAEDYIAHRGYVEEPK
jgi:hypothetical protein